MQSPNPMLMQRFSNIEAEFKQANKSPGDLLLPNDAKVYFDQFQLPNNVMSIIWGKSKKNPNPGLSLEEFKSCMKFIQQELTNPGSLLQEASSTPRSNTTSPAPFDYHMKPEERSQYENTFSNLAKGKYTIPYNECMGLFAKAGLPNEIVNQIWQLVDFERNGMLDKDEFIIAMHLIRLKRKTPQLPIPPQLPSYLVPPSKQSNTLLSPSNDIETRQRSPSEVSNGSSNSFNRGPPTLVTGSGISPNVGGMGMMPPTIMTPNMPSNMGPNIGANMGPNMGGANMGSIRDMENQVNKILDETRFYNQQMFPVRQSFEQNELRLNSLRERKEDLEKDLNIVKNELETLKQQNQIKFEEINTLESQCQVMEQDRLQYQNQIQYVKQELLRLTQVHESALSSHQNVSSAVDSLRNELQQHINDILNTKEELDRLKHGFDNGDSETSRLEEEIRQKSQELSQIKQQLREAQVANDDLQLKIKGLNIQIQEVSQSSDKVRFELNGLISQNEDLKTQIQRYESELEQQKQQSVSKAKIQKLNEIIKRMQDFSLEFENTLRQNFTDSELTVQTTKSPTPVTVKSPVTTTVPTPKVTSPPVNTAPSFGFDANFGSSFDNGFNTTKVNSPPVVTNPVQTQPSFGFDANFDSFGSNNGFDASFDDNSFGNAFGNNTTTSTATTKVPTPVVQQKPPTPQITQPTVQKQDSFGFDELDFGGSKTNGSDDFGFGGFDSKPTNNNNMGFDSFDNFGFGATTTNTSKPTTPQVQSTNTPVVNQPKDSFNEFGFENNNKGGDDFSFGTDFDNFNAKGTNNTSSDPWNDFGTSNSITTKSNAKQTDDWASFDDAF
ncbi:hypothetical protein ABK040_000015 [Willaertia magna]